jgi:hypothetical protein
MPNIVEQRIDSTGIYLRASSGADVTVTQQQILDHYTDTAGTEQQRILDTREWVRSGVSFALGEDQVDTTEIDFDFNPANGEPTLLSIGPV